MAKKYFVQEPERKILRKVIKHILEEPLRLDMQNWVVRNNNVPCKTAACIAGWTCAIANRNVEPITFQYSAEHEARILLKLSYYAVDRLFYLTGWPGKFKEGHWSNVDNPKGRAENAAARIEHFIRTGE